MLFHLGETSIEDVREHCSDQLLLLQDQPQKLYPREGINMPNVEQE